MPSPSTRLCTIVNVLVQDVNGLRHRVWPTSVNVGIGGLRMIIGSLAYNCVEPDGDELEGDGIY